MKAFFYLLVTLAIVTTTIIGFDQGLGFLVLFSISPYLFSLYLVYIAKHKSALLTSKVLLVFIVSVGLYFLLDKTYMEKNLSYKFSFLFIPMWQWTMLLVAGAVVYLSNGSEDDDERGET